MKIAGNTKGTRISHTPTIGMVSEHVGEQAHGKREYASNVEWNFENQEYRSQPPDWSQKVLDVAKAMGAHSDVFRDHDGDDRPAGGGLDIAGRTAQSRGTGPSDSKPG